MSNPNRIKFKGAIYERVVEADTSDPAFQPLLQEFDNEGQNFVKTSKKSAAAMENAYKAVMGEEYNMGYAHMKTANDLLDDAKKQFSAAYEALNSLVGVAGIKAPTKN